MMNQKIIMALMMLAIASVGLAAISTTPVHAVKPQYCSQGGGAEDCSPSQNQCQKKSPGNSGCRSDESD
jgi:hypothetical protein